MAPVNPNMKNRGQFVNKNFKKNYARGPVSAATKKKRKWVPEQKVFDGSLTEGQGFAFKRKEKIRHEYSKLLRKERRRNPEVKIQTTEEYPEHLKHLYLAEKEKLEEEERTKQLKRRKGRAPDPGQEEQTSTNGSDSRDAVASATSTSSDQTGVPALPREQEQPAQRDSFPKTPIGKKKQKMSSYQRTQQEFERRKEERERKREAFLKDKAQREEALKRYKEKKMATYQLLKKKTKKGQPNLNLQMELLLQKIQEQRK
ncbi:thyroid transcription factor 1-associated protein 26 homolog [Chanos chanos]|uniref:Thyroid transcription factor 1-associated protein 26 homolog n=1 Tax=Chanos chanos TaxID=29144 RepID=A0A6J2WB05_CHACN|nr:thyroid transcription factor 1-associated protein 26 [Chanos chanos]